MYKGDGGGGGGVGGMHYLFPFSLVLRLSLLFCCMAVKDGAFGYNPQISSNWGARDGWVVSEPSDVVPSLLPPSIAVSTVS
ncbi:hypothetical protein SLEP1_g25169 [Rubroshorea leprosula]|uniref:Uncharacterized protein n=1 Tax=Rubroshorea leprosula TaxID=152421 RepID=A0AAV5JIA1_9ROSI|nr:hypothetical protein SLEP1_g25169 [Rubroshorea leprosula]